MNITKTRLYRGSRFRLSAHGDATHTAYRLAIQSVRPHRKRTQFEFAQRQWAETHGLDVDDGAYLTELHMAPSTLRELGEALAICGQTREMVREVMTRLVDLGHVVRVTASSARPA